MAEHSHIEWTDATWNPITGCSVVSPGCTNCYAMKMAFRIEAMAAGRDTTSAYDGLTRKTKAGAVWTGQVRMVESALLQPLRWKKPQRIFVNSMSDLFHEDVPDSVIDRVFSVMALAPQHTFQVLTKRSARMRAYISDPAVVRRVYLLACDLAIELNPGIVLIAPGTDEQLAPSGPRVFLGTWPVPNVWLGVSAEDQARADERIPDLLATPAAVRFLSAEPLLGPIDLPAAGMKWNGRLDRETGERRFLDWVIVGGESGPGARPMHPDWARQIRDDCADAGVPFFFKQWGEWAPGENATSTAGRACDAATWFHDRWDIERMTPAASEAAAAFGEEPDVWRAGKRAAGRRLDGVTHDAMPAANGVRVPAR